MSLEEKAGGPGLQAWWCPHGPDLCTSCVFSCLSLLFRSPLARLSFSSSVTFFSRKLTCSTKGLRNKNPEVHDQTTQPCHPHPLGTPSAPIQVGRTFSVMSLSQESMLSRNRSSVLPLLLLKLLLCRSCLRGRGGTLWGLQPVLDPRGATCTQPGG